MDTKSIMAVIIGLMVSGLILVAFVPVFTEVTATEKTFTNEGYYTMDAVDESTSRVIEWDKSTPNTITIDGEPYDMSWTDLAKSYTLIGSEEVILRYEHNLNNTAGLQMFSTTAGSTYVSFHSGTASDAGTKVTVTLGSGAITFVSNGTEPLNKTVSDIGQDAYVINPDNTGEFSFIMKKANEPAYLLGDSTIRFIGVSVSSGPSGIAIYGIGSIEDGMTLSTVYNSATVSDVTYSDPVPTYTEVSGYEDLYLLDKYEFTISYSDNGTPKTFNATYSYFIIPNEVTAEKSVHGDEVFNNIIDLIPLLAGVGLLMAGLYYFISRK